jgi:Restriction endonuclease
MLTDLVSGEQREVDVCAERDVAGDKAIVSIECRDRRRKQGVKWVEQMRGKRDRLPTYVLVLVSSSGFTRTALALAESYGIKAITPRDVTPEFVGQIVNNLDSIQLPTFPWVGFHAARPGSGGQRPPRVSSAMAISASGLWNP